LVNLTRASASPTQAVAYLGITQMEWDAESFLADVSVPTLIISSRGSDMADPLPDARHLAAGISGSQLRVVDGTLAPYWSDRTATLEAIDALLLDEGHKLESGRSVGSTENAKSAPGGMSVIVFTDVVDSTQVMDRLGDEGARTTMRSIEQLVSETATEHSGAVIKQLGDGSMLEFASASNAIEFARKIQIEMQDSQLQLRIGMAAGEPIREDGDVHGAVVVVASRVCDAAGSGEVMVSGGVRQLLVGKQLTFQDHGEQILKGFDDPIRIWQLES
jgi:class 3 adenylate cyclase